MTVQHHARKRATGSPRRPSLDHVLVAVALVGILAAVLAAVWG